MPFSRYSLDLGPFRILGLDWGRLVGRSHFHPPFRVLWCYPLLMYGHTASCAHPLHRLGCVIPESALQLGCLVLTCCWICPLLCSGFYQDWLIPSSEGAPLRLLSWSSLFSNEFEQRTPFRGGLVVHSPLCTMVGLLVWLNWSSPLCDAFCESRLSTMTWCDLAFPRRLFVWPRISTMSIMVVYIFLLRLAFIVTDLYW